MKERENRETERERERERDRETPTPTRTSPRLLWLENESVTNEKRGTVSWCPHPYSLTTILSFDLCRRKSSSWRLAWREKGGRTKCK